MSSTGSSGVWRHLDGCFGCGPANPASLGLEMSLEGGVAVAMVTFDDRHIGAPGLVHGGALMTMLDEVMGSVPGSGEGQRMTASMDVRFRRPVELGRTVRASGQIVDRDGSRFTVRATLTYLGDDTVRTEATAWFVLLGSDSSRR